MLLFKHSLRCNAVIVLVGATLALSACGFRPLYGQFPGSPAVAAQLNTIQVTHIVDRRGQMLRTALQRRLNPKPLSAVHYKLTVTLKESVSKLAIERNAAATRANLTLVASYELVGAQDHHMLAKGSTRAVASYNILSSEFATLQAQSDSRERATDTLADDLRTRLAAYFTKPGGPTPVAQP